MISTGDYMALIQLSQIIKSYGVDPILTGIDLIINPGDRIGLIGRNGAGKTTLFRILSGRLSYDTGTMQTAKDCRVGYLEQMPDYGDMDVYTYCLGAFEDILALHQLRTDLEHQMTEAAAHGEVPEDLMHAYSHTLDVLANGSGYSYDSEIKGMLRGLGFNDDQIKQKACELSGGQKSRVNLARLLLSRPDLYLLDEPTNHLDMASVRWLEGYIRKSTQTFVIITHDRYFLDQVVDRIVEIENGKSLECKGSYSEFVRFKDAVYENLMNQYENAMEEYGRQEEIVRRMKQHGTEKLAKRAKSREKVMDRIVIPDKPLKYNEVAKLKLKACSKTGYDVLSAEGVSKSYGDRTLFENLSFQLYAGERIGLIGPNGCGKTTLFKLISGSLRPDDGAIRLGQHVKFGEYDQDLTPLSMDHTLIDEISDENPKLDTTDIRSLLGAFLFKGDEVQKQMKDLSGGELARVRLLRLMLEGSNVLLMDEPTNHLDIASREVLESALDSYDGTIVAISHDRYFLNRVCTRILSFEDGQLVEYLGNYDYYVEKTEELAEMDRIADEGPTKTKTQIKDERRKEREKSQEVKKIRQTIAQIETLIATSESKIGELEVMLCDEAIYSDYEEAGRIHGEISRIKNELAGLYEEWETLV